MEDRGFLHRHRISNRRIPTTDRTPTLSARADVGRAARMLVVAQGLVLDLIRTTRKVESLRLRSTSFRLAHLLLLVVSTVSSRLRTDKMSCRLHPRLPRTEGCCRTRTPPVRSRPRCSLLRLTHLKRLLLSVGITIPLHRH